MKDSTPPSWSMAHRHWKDRLAGFGGRWILRPTLALPIPLSVHRRAFEFFGRRRRMHPDVNIAFWDGGRTGSCLFIPPSPKRRILWFHGGGFVVGSPRSYRAMLSQLAILAEAVIIAPSYRLAPEHPFPAAACDAESAAIAAWDCRVDLGPLVIGGDSAGGNLAAVALAHLLRLGKRPAATILASPATWIDPNRPVPAAQDRVFPVKALEMVGQAYAQTSDPSDPRLSPRFADFTDAPSTLIHCAKGELLEQDSRLIAQQMQDHGTDVTLERAPDAPHVWHFMAGGSPLAMDALGRMADFAKAHT